MLTPETPSPITENILEYSYVVQELCRKESDMQGFKTKQNKTKQKQKKKPNVFQGLKKKEVLRCKVRLALSVSTASECVD